MCPLRKSGQSQVSETFPSRCEQMPTTCQPAATFTYHPVECHASIEAEESSSYQFEARSSVQYLHISIGYDCIRVVVISKPTLIAYSYSTTSPTSIGLATSRASYLVDLVDFPPGTSPSIPSRPPKTIPLVFSNPNDQNDFIASSYSSSPFFPQSIEK